MSEFFSEHSRDPAAADRVAVVCPNCGAAYRIAAKLVGRRLQCKHCRKEWRAAAIPREEINRIRRERREAPSDSGHVELYTEGGGQHGSSSVAIDMSWAGKRIGRYKAKSLLGYGGMGVVWRAHDDSLRRDVALKILTRTRSETEKGGLNLDLFMQEARAVARLQHPAVVAIYEIDEDQGHVFLALELMDGGTLKELVERTGPVKPRELFEWLLGPVKALALAHRSDIVHRDIKPSNLMFDDHGHMKLMDFGLADVAGEEVSERLKGKAVGSLGWIAPETANGRDTTTRSDLYSLGLVMYYALTGRPLIHGKSRSIVIALHREPPKVALDGVKGLTTEGRRLIEKCLAVNPDDRFQSASELYASLESCAADDPAERKKQRKLMLGFVAIAAVLSAIISVGTVLYVMVSYINRERQYRQPIFVPAKSTEGGHAPDSSLESSLGATPNGPSTRSATQNAKGDSTDARVPWPEVIDGSTLRYIGSTHGRVFHDPAGSCGARQILAGNLIVFDSYQAAIDAGRVPCNQCNPQP